MCFSAAASFAAGAALGATGAVTVTKAVSSREKVFAAMPLLFAVQQTIEGGIWLTLTRFPSSALNAALTYGYVFFSHALWPVFIPAAIFLMEPSLQRKSLLKIFLGLGLCLSAYLLYFIVRYPIVSSLVCQDASFLCYSVRYSNPYAYPYFSTALYLLVTCGSCLISTHTFVKIFGAALLASFFVAYQVYYHSLFSVWCFFAALLSAVVYLHVISRASRRKANRKSGRGNG